MGLVYRVITLIILLIDPTECAIGEGSSFGIGVVCRQVSHSEEYFGILPARRSVWIRFTIHCSTIMLYIFLCVHTNMTKLTILSVATKECGYFEILKQSCKKYNLNLIIVGWGREWDGWITRLEWIYEAMLEIPKDHIVLVVDAYDVIFFADETEILEKFRREKCGLLVGSDNQCNRVIPKSFAGAFFNRTQKQYENLEYYLICAGTFATTPYFFCETIFPLLYSYIQDTKDDQVAFTTLSLEHPNLVKVDYECRMFQTCFPCGMYDIFESYSLEIFQQKRIYNKKYKSYPVLLHGGGNSDLCPIIRPLYPDYTCIPFTEYQRLKKTISYSPSMIKHTPSIIKTVMQRNFMATTWILIHLLVLIILLLLFV